MSYSNKVVNNFYKCVFLSIVMFLVSCNGGGGGSATRVQPSANPTPSRPTSSPTPSPTSSPTPSPTSSPTPSQTPNTYAYFSNLDSTYTKCLVNVNKGSLNSCNTVTPSGSSKQGPLAISNGNVYSIVNTPYINDKYIKCGISSTTGIISDCSTYSMSPSVSQNIPDYVAINNGYAYYINWEGGIIGSYTVCSIDSSHGLLNKCSTQVPDGPGTLYEPVWIEFNNGFAYIIDEGTSSFTNMGYTQCTVAPNGILTNCYTYSMGYGSNTPTSIAFNNGYAYIFIMASFALNDYYVCQVNSTTGNLMNCNEQPFRYTNGWPLAVAFNNNFAYIANNNGTYTQCGIDSNFLLSSCKTSVLLEQSYPVSITFNTIQP